MNLRYAIRSLARTPGFTITAILTLALGIGATTAMLTILDGVLFKPLSFADADRLYVTQTLMTVKQSAAAARRFPVNAHHFSDWRDRCEVCDEVALIGASGVTLTGAGNPERLPGLAVSYNLFRTLQVRPAIGRDFTADDEGPGKPAVILLTDPLWRRAFNADAGIVGRTIVVNGIATTVVGVMPAELRMPRGEEWGPLFGHTDVPLFFQPFTRDFKTVPTTGNFNYIALVRARPGVDPRRLESELNTIIAPYSRETPATASAIVTPLASQMTDAVAKYLWLLAAAVATVLLLVSLNVGGLLLTRGVSRARDTGIRLALGAEPRDLFRLVLTETATLVAAGAVAGLALADLALRAFVGETPVNLPRMDEIRPDWHLIAFGFVTMSVATVLASIAPVLRVSRGDVRATLVSATRSATQSRSGVRALDIVIAAQVALSTAILLVAALLVMSFLKVMKADRGFDADQVVTQSISLASTRYNEPAARMRFVERALEQFGRLPGVVSVGETSQLPLQGEGWIDSLIDPDRGDEERTAPLTNHRFVSPRFMTAMGIPLRSGRDFTESDRDHAVAIISERAARLLWPHESAIGRHVRGPGGGGRPGDPIPAAEVIGVVADVKSAGLENDPPPIVYSPYWRVPGGPGGPLFAIRTTRDAASLAGDIRTVLAALDPELPAQPPQSMTQTVWAAASLRLFQTSIVAAFTCAALVIAAIGLYGLVSFSVVRRTREIGVRVALGASPSDVAALVFGQGLRPIVLGAAAGFAAAWAAGDVLASALYGVTPHDPVAFAATASIWLVVSVIATWVPMRRAAAVDPVISLRAE